MTLCPPGVVHCRVTGFYVLTMPLQTRSYPQGLSVVAPAPLAMQGLYVVATNNKEDVVVTRVPWAALLAEL